MDWSPGHAAQQGEYHEGEWAGTAFGSGHSNFGGSERGGGKASLARLLTVADLVQVSQCCRASCDVACAFLDIEGDEDEEELKGESAECELGDCESESVGTEAEIARVTANDWTCLVCGYAYNRAAKCICCGKRNSTLPPPCGPSSSEDEEEQPVPDHILQARQHERRELEALKQEFWQQRRERRAALGLRP
jgi:hypothetical protein